MGWLGENLGLVVDLTLQHARLSVIPIVVSLVAALPLGWVISRSRLGIVLLGVGNVIYTIPSLALFVSLPAILGTRILDETNVVVALSLYGVTLMMRGVADAFGSVSDDVRQSARAIGYSAAGRFASVELPLAAPVIIANLRVVSVSTISLLSVAAIIGQGGLGYLFTDGYSRDFPAEVLIGIVATLVIAVVFDLVIVAAGRILLPWQRPARRGRARASLALSPDAAGGAS
ncbi:ABC transporter permease [Galbitalea sp. SE-J8]|uniref:ABC transporter permease n=1 Tax=Galbitalea sp. SE-J8 TaxID=3054952 RepID=UPI00259C92A4|nr:ABC transporter permease [Galbitalea sp. SE-J8]MDM4761791.1 ABC transporter permease [Galbitalea sp. SE-J8]